MRWTQHDDGWRWRFAILPQRIPCGSGKYRWIWLEWYRRRFCGYFYEVKL